MVRLLVEVVRFGERSCSDLKREEFINVKHDDSDEEPVAGSRRKRTLARVWADVCIILMDPSKFFVRKTEVGFIETKLGRPLPEP